jgi:hypothetical protein
MRSAVSDSDWPRLLLEILLALHPLQCQQRHHRRNSRCFGEETRIQQVANRTRDDARFATFLAREHFLKRPPSRVDPIQ